jgi:predicted RNA-binding protein
MNTYKFSEYDFNLPDEMKEEVIALVKIKLEDFIKENIVKLEDYYYSIARSENKFGREVEEISSETFAQSLVDNITY